MVEDITTVGIMEIYWFDESIYLKINENPS